ILAALPAAARGQSAAPGTGRDSAHYIADRPVDFVHMRLELTFTSDGLRARACDGRVEYTLRPRATPVRTIRLDAAGLRILAVELSASDTAPEFAYDDRTLTVQLPKPVGRDETVRLAVRYCVADPARGMHFVLPSASRPERPLMVYTQ